MKNRTRMKRTLLLIILTAALLQAHKASANTYTITTSTDWLTVVGSNSCWTCTFNINAGATFTLDYNGTCGTCTFNNGTLSVTQNLTCQACTFNTETITASNIELNLQSNTNNFNNSSVTIGGTGFILVTAGLSLTNSQFVFNNSSYLNMNGGAFTASNSQVTFNSSSYFTATSGPISVENNSEMLIGDGTNNSTAYMHLNGPALQIYDNSMVKISNQKNYYQNGNSYKYFPTSGGSSSISTNGNHLNCNQGAVTGYANSCSNNYVYGCATLNGSGLAACSTLATANIDLTASESAPGTVNLAWSDNTTAPADTYTIERSTGNDSWTTIATVSANSYNTGDYHYTDNDAPAGAIDYRIARTDASGLTIYSPVSVVNGASITGMHLGIHPNPAAGGLFYITTIGTEELLVNVYTTTGQLLYHTDLKGQTQYAIQLPSQPLSLSAVIVQTIYQNNTRSFPLLVR